MQPASREHTRALGGARVSRQSPRKPRRSAHKQGTRVAGGRAQNTGALAGQSHVGNEDTVDGECGEAGEAALPPRKGRKKKS